ncbi:ATP-grasp domain-containing protein [Candidatus Albibeggiatoa sp. nov. NOAA]|uniref:ATP-grasp domain-containing protein n=1 Tax=Candidatus Albibeggiatoa sp. nov. NOAA TaxID=3162724 RepID=UPI0032FD4F45|nr:ATP-grasp domain-containing protein [Thiotrichaceae bacterium]
MSKKLLIAGGGYADIPLILAAKKLGYYVITSGNRPHELGHRYSDEYQPADFSKPDEIFQLSERLKIDAICACCNDFSALSVAYTAEKLGLAGHDSYETAKIIHHKDRYRQFALENNIATPKAIGFTDIDDAMVNLQQLSFPIIVKPVDLTGGKGMSVLNGVSEAKAALEKAFSASHAKRVVVEEFIEGSRHGFSAFLYQGKIVFHFSDNEHYFKNPYLVSAASTPSIVPENAINKLCAESEKIAALLSLKDGIFHVQYILHNGEPVIIEICRRSPGDLYIQLVAHATGVQYAEWIVKAAIGLDCRELSHAEPQGFFTRHCIMSAEAGIVDEVKFDKSIQDNIINKYEWWQSGQTITDIMTTKLGIVFFKFDSLTEMLEKTEHMQSLVKVQIK